MSPQLLQLIGAMIFIVGLAMQLSRPGAKDAEEEEEQSGDAWGFNQVKDGGIVDSETYELDYSYDEGDYE